MKSKYLIILAAVASIFSSCDMDLAPVGSLPDDSAIETLNDAQRFRNGLYSNSRSFNTSGFFTVPELQADMFNGLVINGNRNGPIANGDVVPSNDEITAYWLLLYGNIANCNYYLEVMEPLLEKTVAANDQISAAKLRRFIGEAHFFRGYYYAMMFDRFCTLYSEAKGNTEALGLPIVTKWAPTSNRDTYPGRSTMNETLKFINDDLQAALVAISEYEETGYDPTDDNAVRDVNELLAPNAPYISSWGVRAFQARLALWTGKYQEALDLAQGVINCGIYTLATATNYKTMWTKDAATEVIYRPYMSSNELSNSIGSSWLGTESTQADYIPTSTVIEDYESFGKHGTGASRRWKDARYLAFVDARTLQSAFGDTEAPCFVKFPGNPDLQVSSQVNLMNMPKTFRLSEMYFIAMESAMELGKEDVAKSLLNTYMSNRMANNKEPDGIPEGGAELVEYIRKQRGLEFIGEGFRISDLRRWHKGFNRAGGAAYENAEISPLLTAAGLNVVYTSDDPRYTWPIPNDELRVNPQMAGQQNPGY